MILVHHIKTRARLLRFQVPMSHNQGIGISPVKLLQQLAQGSPLGIRPGVSRFSVYRQAADVTDSNRMTVMVLAMRSDFDFIPTRFDGSVCRNHIVIPTTFPSQRAMITVDVREAEGTARLVGGTVHDNQGNGSHRLLPSAPPAAPVINNSTSFTM